ncbi:MAG: hypothetical protein C4316_10625 [Chloroflexota bacterium]
MAAPRGSRERGDRGRGSGRMSPRRTRGLTGRPSGTAPARLRPAQSPHSSAVGSQRRLQKLSDQRAKSHITRRWAPELAKACM